MRNFEISRVLNAARQTPWAILPEKLAEIQAVLLARLSGAEISAEDRAAYIKAADERQRYQQQGAVAVIPVFGVIAQRMGLMGAMSGGTSTEGLTKQIREAAADPSIASIVLNVDSPGGSVSGLPELHAEIMAAREAKPVVASANATMASAAYYIGSAASEVAITPSGRAGSVGVIAMHIDDSAALEQDGIKVTYITAGKFKSEANPHEPLTEEARAQLQSDVDKYYAMFVRDVAKGRGISIADVKSNFGEGRMLLAQDAKAAGMVDRIETLDQTIARLSRSSRPVNSRKAIAERLDMAAKFL